MNLQTFSVNHYDELCQLLNISTFLLTISASTEPKLIIATVPEASAKRARLVPPASERIMIYVRQETEV